MAIKRVPSFRALANPNGSCVEAWKTEYRFVGTGYCRPTDGYVTAGKGLQDGDCARQCTDASECHAFANVKGGDLECVLYPEPATSSSMEPSQASVDCYTMA